LLRFLRRASRIPFPPNGLSPRLTPRGVILVDNVLWGGGVADPDQDDDTTESLRAFNAHAAADPRSQLAMLPVGDGLTVITLR